MTADDRPDPMRSTPPAGLSGWLEAADWTASPLGAPAAWPPQLSMLAAVIAASPHPMVVWWGPHKAQLHNAAFCALLNPPGLDRPWGRPAADAASVPWKALADGVEQVLAGGPSHTVTADLHWPDLGAGAAARSRWTCSLGPVPVASGIGGVLGLITDVTCRDAAEEVIRRQNAALAEQTERQRRMFEQAPGFIAVLRGPDHEVELANRAYLRLLGAGGDVLRQRFRDAFPGLQGQHFFELLDRVHRTGEPFVGREVPVDVPDPIDGTARERLVDFIYQPIMDAEGQVVGVFVEGSDVTDRVRLQKRQSLLIRELHHRVRNTLATVQGIMGASARASETIADFREAFAGRISAMAKTHALLTEHHWQKAGLRDLLHQELEPFDDGKGARILLEGPDVELPSDMAVPIGMAIHEMTTNAVRHGSLSRPGGTLEVRWTTTPMPGGCQLTWLWLERGGPPVIPPGREGFGTRLLQRVLSVQTKADVRVDFDEEGLKVVILMTVPEGDEDVAEAVSGASA